MKRVYIADIRSNCNDGKCTGHYIPVAKNYYDIIGNDAEVKIAAGPIYGDAFPEETMLWLPYSVSGGGGFFNFILGKIKTLINVYVLLKKVASGSIIIWQHTDLIALYIGLLLFCRRKDLQMFQILYYATKHQVWFRKILFKCALRKMKGIICPTPELGQLFGIPYCVVPDYIYTGNAQATSLVPYKEKQYDFCLVGRFNKHKGVADIIRILRNKSYRVLVAGRPDSDDYAKRIQELVADSPNIELNLGFIETDQYHHYIDNSKYCILNYQKEYSNRSSGVVYDTLFAGVPVIGRLCTALEMVREYSMGYLYDEPDKVSWDEFLNQERYEHYLLNILKYKSIHQSYILRIKDFINIL